jgi:hypothetical protein
MSKELKKYEFSYVITISANIYDSDRSAPDKALLIVKDGEIGLFGKCTKDAIRILTGELQNIIQSEFIAKGNNGQFNFYYHLEMERPIERAENGLFY